MSSPPSSLALQIDAWTTQTLSASRRLLRLYRALGDGKQASVVLQVMAPAEERARRLGLAESTRESAPGSEGWEAEMEAWRALLEAQAGMCIFHGVLEDRGTGGLRGARHAAFKAFDRAIRGLRTAFPEDLARETLDQVLQAAARTSAGLFAEDLGRREEGLDTEDLARNLFADILGSLRAQLVPEGGVG